MSKEQIRLYLTGRIIDKLTEFLMHDHRLNLQEAIDIIYNSDTLGKLENKKTELYIQSPAYVYELLDYEYKNGHFPNS